MACNVSKSYIMLLADCPDREDKKEDLKTSWIPAYMSRWCYFMCVCVSYPRVNRNISSSSVDVSWHEPFLFLELTTRVSWSKSGVDNEQWAWIVRPTQHPATCVCVFSFSRCVIASRQLVHEMFVQTFLTTLLKGWAVVWEVVWFVTWLTAVSGLDNCFVETCT